MKPTYFDRMLWLSSNLPFDLAARSPTFTGRQVGGSDAISRKHHRSPFSVLRLRTDYLQEFSPTKMSLWRNALIPGAVKQKRRPASDPRERIAMSHSGHDQSLLRVDPSRPEPARKRTSTGPLEIPCLSEAALSHSLPDAGLRLIRAGKRCRPR